jgi:hypothetical protein
VTKINEKYNCNSIAPGVLDDERPGVQSSPASRHSPSDLLRNCRTSLKGVASLVLCSHSFCSFAVVCSSWGELNQACLLSTHVSESNDSRQLPLARAWELHASLPSVRIQLYGCCRGFSACRCVFCRLLVCFWRGYVNTRVFLASLRFPPRSRVCGHCCRVPDASWHNHWRLDAYEPGIQVD